MPVQGNRFLIEKHVFQGYRTSFSVCSKWFWSNLLPRINRKGERDRDSGWRGLRALPPLWTAANAVFGETLKGEEKNCHELVCTLSHFKTWQGGKRINCWMSFTILFAIIVFHIFSKCEDRVFGKQYGRLHDLGLPKRHLFALISYKDFMLLLGHPPGPHLSSFSYLAGK